MNCEAIKDLILTDYVDGQLDAQKKEELEAHLKKCPECQAFAIKVQKDLVAPFEKAEVAEVPEHIWQNIKECIDPVEEVEPSWKSVLRFIGNLQALRQAAYLLAGFIFVISVGMLLLQPAQKTDFIAGQDSQVTQLAKANDMRPSEGSQPESYLAYFDEDYGDVYEMVDDGYGTDIEEYFL